MSDGNQFKIALAWRQYLSGVPDLSVPFIDGDIPPTGVFSRVPASFKKGVEWSYDEAIRRSSSFVDAAARGRVEQLISHPSSNLDRVMESFYPTPANYHAWQGILTRSQEMVNRGRIPMHQASFWQGVHWAAVDALSWWGDNMEEWTAACRASMAGAIERYGSR